MDVRVAAYTPLSSTGNTSPLSKMLQPQQTNGTNPLANLLQPQSTEITQQMTRQIANGEGRGQLVDIYA